MTDPLDRDTAVAQALSDAGSQRVGRRDDFLASLHAKGYDVVPAAGDTVGDAGLPHQHNTDACDECDTLYQQGRDDAEALGAPALAAPPPPRIDPEHIDLRTAGVPEGYVRVQHDDGTWCLHAADEGSAT